MFSTDAEVIRWGDEQARAGPWQQDRRIAYLVPVPDGSVPSMGFVRWAMGELDDRGFSGVVTNALPPSEQVAFLGAGFEVREHLHVLGHDLQRVPLARPAGLRRARRSDHQSVLEVDALAFPPFWRLDRRSLGEVVRATPWTRFRVALHRGAVVAYAVTGRAGRRGFLQRLAVHPGHRRRGIGRALAVDGLRWLQRWRVTKAVVNTPADNHPALHLYEGVGFRREPRGLAVLSAELDGRGDEGLR